MIVSGLENQRARECLACHDIGSAVACARLENSRTESLPVSSLWVGSGRGSRAEFSTLTTGSVCARLQSLVVRDHQILLDGMRLLLAVRPRPPPPSLSPVRTDISVHRRRFQPDIDLATWPRIQSWPPGRQGCWAAGFLKVASGGGARARGREGTYGILFHARACKFPSRSPYR